MTQLWLAACLAYQQKWTGHLTIARQGLHIMTDDPTSVPWPGPGLELVQDNPWPVAVADWDWIVGALVGTYGSTSFSKGITVALVNLLKLWPLYTLANREYIIMTYHDSMMLQPNNDGFADVNHGGPWILEQNPQVSGWWWLMFISKKRNQSSTEHEVGVVYTTDRSSALQNRCLTDALVLAVELSEVAIQQLSYWNLGLANKNKPKNFGNVAKNIGVSVCWRHLTNSGCGCKTCKWAGGWKYDHTQLKHKLQQAPSGMLFSL